IIEKGEEVEEEEDSDEMEDLEDQEFDQAKTNRSSIKSNESMQVDNSNNNSLKKTEIGNADNSIPTLTTATLEKLQEAITQSYSLRSLQKLLLAFRAAAHLNDDEEKRYSYKINDAAESEKAVPYYACFPKLSKHYLKQLLDIWGTAEDKARIAAFLNIRKLASIAPPPFIDLCLKGIYTTFVRYCKETTIFTIPSINLMCNCAVEMYGINLKSSYQSAFNYIRQLAIHLRNSINNKNEETFNSVYNWQYIHCIEYWSKVLANYCDQTRESTNNKGSLQELIYPLVQVCTGVIRLNITAQYFPLHFHCIRSLIHLIKKTGTFIPLAPYLFDILLSAEIHRKPKLATLKPLDFSSTLKTPKVYLHTKVYQDGICEELVELLFEYYSCYSLSIAFPELAIPAIIHVKRHIKNSKSVKFNRQLQQFVEKMEQNSKFIEQERSRIDFSPNNRAQVKAFLRNVDSDSTPLGEYVKATRELKEQRQKLMAIDSTNE
ncbi:10961_t:CDS:10, partial [Gigaspora margarita]